MIPRLEAGAARSVLAHPAGLVERGERICDGLPTLEAHRRPRR